MLVSSLGANPASEYRLPSSPPPPFTPSPYAADDVPDPSEFLVDCDTLLYAPLRLCRSRYRRSSHTAMIPQAQRRARPPRTAPIAIPVTLLLAVVAVLPSVDNCDAVPAVSFSFCVGVGVAVVVVVVVLMLVWVWVVVTETEWVEIFVLVIIFVEGGIVGEEELVVMKAE